jgi:Bacterial membrane protein YfhO
MLFALQHYFKASSSTNALRTDMYNSFMEQVQPPASEVAVGSLSVRWRRVALLLFGLVSSQILLYGPSLAGTKVLLPLDILAEKDVYLPTPANGVTPVPFDYVLSDLVLLGVPSMEYAAREMRAGRIPLWNPQSFAGVPFAAFPKYSPFFLIFCCWPSPTTFAYLQLIMSGLAGVGAYLFFRRALGVGFWAATIGAWCYPLTGFFVQWQGYSVASVVVWLPWILLAVDYTVRDAKGFGPILLGTFTAAAALSGQLDVAAVVLLSSGLYAIARLVEAHGWTNCRRGAIPAIAALILGWGLGLCIAAPYIVPLVEYLHTGERMSKRAAGEEERPPVGLAALPQIVLPNLYGSTRKGSMRYVDGTQPESSAAGYAGLLATLLLAPLAFCHRDLKGGSFWWLGLLVLSLGWVLNIPGLVHLMRLPGANMLSYNRWMMLSGFALTVLAVTGIDAVIKEMVKPRHWFAVPALLAAGLCAWCVYRMGHMPDVPANVMYLGIPVPQALAIAQEYFTFYYAAGAGLAALTVVGWTVLYLGAQRRGWMVAIAGSLMMAELLMYAYNTRPQCDRAMYYPRIPALEELKQRPSGRILGVSCLPPALNLMLGLPDIRGYDAVDPKRLLDVLEFARQGGPSSLPYARTQWFIPWIAWTNDGSPRISPVLSMLNVRHLIFCQDLSNQIKAIIRGDGYTVVENEFAMARTFVPQTVQVVDDEQQLMDQVRTVTFDPARVSYVTEHLDLPAESRGSARILEESPERVVVDARMDTAGVVVLADLWDKGWQARVDGQVTPILVVNHAIRGVVLPAGQHQVVFRYVPDSVRIGWIMSSMAVAVGLGWAAWIMRWRLKARRTAQVS